MSIDDRVWTLVNKRADRPVFRVVVQYRTMLATTGGFMNRLKVIVERKALRRVAPVVFVVIAGVALAACGSSAATGGNGGTGGTGGTGGHTTTTTSSSGGVAY
jgi:uncharacterized membrane protein YgcG